MILNLDQINQLQQSVIELGNILKSRRNEFSVGSYWEKNNLKTKADMFSHDYLCSLLRGICNIPILSEEDETFSQFDRPNSYWIIDPIDGTRSYTDGFWGWVIQLCYVELNEIVFSIIHAPDLDETYVATKGQGAFLNGALLSDITKRMAFDTLIDNYPQPKGVSAHIFHAFNCLEYIECGSLGLKICKVASGMASIFVKDVKVRDWDIAPAYLVLSEVKGHLTDMKGNPFLIEGNVEKQGIIVTNCLKSLNKCALEIKKYGSV